MEDTNTRNQKAYIEEVQTIQWPKEEVQTIQWPKEEVQTIQWPKEEVQTTQWPKEEVQTIQWPKDQTTIYKPLHRKLKIEHHELIKNRV
jgi:hypothetical protein